MLKSVKICHIFLVLFFVGIVLLPFFRTSAQIANISASVKISVCGNNIKEGSEQCDNTDLNNNSCVSLGWSGGTLGCSPACVFDTSACSSGGGGGGGGSYTPPQPQAETKIIFRGISFPGADISILKGGWIIITTKANSVGDFQGEISNAAAGTWTFNLWAEDSEDRRSSTISLTATIQEGRTTTFYNIFLPPTIELSANQIIRSQPINIVGQTALDSEVEISISSVTQPSRSFSKTTKATADGFYFYNLDTIPLELEKYLVKAKSSRGNELVSDFSEIMSFQVFKPGTAIVSPQKNVCLKVNLNCDFDEKTRDKINFVDISVLLYNWGKPKNPAADLNNDDVVDYRDLSILLYYWTG